MTAHVKVSGTWEEVAEAYAKVSGTWEKCKLSARASGSWRDILPIITLNGHSVVHVSSNATAGIRFNTDGTVDQRVGATYTQIDSPDWCDPVALAPGNYEIMATLLSGTEPAAVDPLDTWLALTSDREWRRVTSSSLLVSELQIDIRLGSLIVATGVYDLEADAT